MKTVWIVVALAVGGAGGWVMRAPPHTGVLDGTEEIVVQHPSPNAYGAGSRKTRIRLYSVGDEDFGPMPENTSSATFWIVTIGGTNYRGVAQE